MRGAGHTAALFLFAIGALTAIFGGLGTSLEPDDLYWWLTLLAGLGLFVIGVWIYRRSDRTMAEVGRQDGSVATRTFPLLHPVRLGSVW